MALCYGWREDLLNILPATMNDTATNAGGYAASKMCTEKMPVLYNKLKEFIPEEHIYNQKLELFSLEEVTEHHDFNGTRASYALFRMSHPYNWGRQSFLRTPDPNNNTNFYFFAQDQYIRSLAANNANGSGSSAAMIMAKFILI